MAVLALIVMGVMVAVVFVARSVIQLRTTGDSGLRAGALTAPAGTPEWWAGRLLLLALVAVPGAPVAEILGMDPLTAVGWVRWTGTGLAGLGTTMMFLAQMHMGAEWRIGVDTGERTRLVTGGAFRMVRNPIFSAMILAAVGLVLMVPNPISIAGLALLVGAIELQVRSVEEPHLRRLHGEAYEAYASRVGRFVPGLGTL